jgi:hypothetical protein
MQWSIPISELGPEIAAASIYDSLPMLRLEKGTLHKQSYVRTDHTYGIPVSMLRQYNFRIHQAYAKRLCEHSYTILARRLKLGAPTYTPTSVVRKTGVSQLADLASTGGMIKSTSTNLRVGTTPRWSSRARRSSLFNESYSFDLLPTSQRRYTYWTEDYDPKVKLTGFSLDFGQTLAVFLLAGLPVWWLERWNLVVYLIAGPVTWLIPEGSAVVHLAIAPVYWWLLEAFITLSFAIIPWGSWWILVNIAVTLYFISLLSKLPNVLLKYPTGHG